MQDVVNKNLKHDKMTTTKINKMNKEEIISELKKYLVYNQYRDIYVIRGENLPFLSERLVKLFFQPVVVLSCDDNCKMNYCDNKCCIEHKKVLVEPTDLPEYGV